MDKLTIQLDAINRYIDNLLKCDKENRNTQDAYREIVNELRVESGKKPFDYKKAKQLQEEFFNKTI